MLSKKCVFVFAACLAIGVYAVSLDDARKQLDDLADVATENSQTALKLLNRVADGIRELANRAMASGKRLVEQEEERLNNNIKDIVSYADKMKVNVSSCFNAKHGLLKELTDVTLLEVVTCVDTYSNGGTRAVSEALGRLNIVLTDVFTLRNKLESCKVNDVACINNVVTEINFEEKDIPRRIQDELDTATNKAEVNGLFLADCGLKEAESLLIHGADLVRDLQACVDVLIDGKTTRRPF